MANLSIPSAVAEHVGLTAAAKLTYADLLSRIKKGEQVDTGLYDMGIAVALGGDDDRPKLLDALRNLEDFGFARIDETVNPLEHVVSDQQVRLTAMVMVEVRPRLDPEKQDERRYSGGLNEKFWDEAQVGRTIYRGDVTRVLADWVFNLKAKDDEGERVIHEDMGFPSLGAAWEFFDETVAMYRREFEGGAE